MLMLSGTKLWMHMDLDNKIKLHTNRTSKLKPSIRCDGFLLPVCEIYYTDRMANNKKLSQLKKEYYRRVTLVGGQE